VKARRLSVWQVVFGLVALLAFVRVAPALVEGKLLSGGDLISARDTSLQPSLDADGGNPFRFDSAYVFQPDLEAARAQLARGHLPLWTSGIGAGRPLLASQQHGVLFPLTAVALLLPVDRAMGVIAFLKIAFAGFGMLFFLRALGLRALPCLLGAACFCLGTYFTSWLEHPQANAYLLLPWLMWAARAAANREGGRLPWLALTLLAGLAWLAGHPQSAVLVLAASAAYFAWTALPHKGPGRHRRRWGSGARFAVAMVGGLLLGLVMLWPFLDAARQGVALERGGGSGAGGPLSVLVSIVAPDYWGDASAAGSPGPINYPERTIYIGIVPALLAVLTLWRPTRDERFFLGLMVLSAILALDLNTGIQSLPGLDAINLLRGLVIVTFCLAVLAAIGLQRLLAEPVLAGRRLGIVAAGTAAVALCVAVAGSAGGAMAPNATGAMVRFGLLATLAAVLGLVALKARGGALVAVGIVLVLASTADVLNVTHGYYRFLAPGDQRLAPSSTVSKLQDRRGERFAAEGLLGPNLALTYGLEDVRAHDHPAVWRYSRLWNALVPQSPLIRTDLVNTANQFNKALDLFSVGSVLIGPGGNTGGLGRPERLGNARLWTNPGAFPRAFFVSRWRSADTREDALNRVVASDTGLLETLPIIEGARSGLFTAGSVVPARRVPRSEERTDVYVTAPKAGFLVLQDTYFRGWRATVDGKPARIHAANVGFRAVAVAKGRHIVRFTYAPGFVGASVLIGLGTLLVLLLLAVVPLRELRRRRRLNPPARSAPLALPSWPAVREATTAWIGRGEDLVRAVAGAPPRTREAGQSRGVSRRRVAVGGLAALAGFGTGAVLAASLHPLGKNRYEAEAVVAVSGRDARDGSRLASLATVKDLVALPQVQSAAARSLPPAERSGSLAKRISVIGAADSTLVRIRARGGSPDQARALADSVTGQAIKFNRRAAHARLAEAGPQMFDFMRGREGWKAGSRYTLPARRTALIEGADRAFRFSCSARRPGCGPGVRLDRKLDVGTSYTARIVVRGRTGANPVRAVLGSESGDVAVGKPTTVRRGTPATLQVDWTPRRGTSDVVLALQTTGRGPLSMDISRADVDDSTASTLSRASRAALAIASKRRSARQAAAADGLSVAAKAQSTGVSSEHSGAWVLGGGLLGLLVLVAARFAAVVAGGRGHDAEGEPNSDVETVG
jgi:hypothetical protein